MPDQQPSPVSVEALQAFYAEHGQQNLLLKEANVRIGNLSNEVARLTAEVERLTALVPAEPAESEAEPGG